MGHQIYYIFNVLENQDTPNIVKEKIVTKVADNSKTGIYLVYYISNIIEHILKYFNFFFVIILCNFQVYT